MPIYEFNCHKCNKKFELILKRHDKDKKQPCPECGDGVKAEEFQKSGFILKGSGWYRNGY